MTLSEAKARVTFLNQQMRQGVSRTMRPSLVAELARLTDGLYRGDFKDPIAANRMRRDPVSVVRDAGQVADANARLAKFQPVPYTGPRCDFCGGPVPDGACLNRSGEWPHPPEETRAAAPRQEQP